MTECVDCESQKCDYCNSGDHMTRNMNDKEDSDWSYERYKALHTLGRGPDEILGEGLPDLFPIFLAGVFGIILFVIIIAVITYLEPMLAILVILLASIVVSWIAYKVIKFFG